MRTDREAPRLMPRDWMTHGLVYLALATIAIAQPLLQLYGENVAVFAAAGFEEGRRGARSSGMIKVSNQDIKVTAAAASAAAAAASTSFAATVSSRSSA